MLLRNLKTTIFLSGCVIGFSVLLALPDAHGVPSFARQTGMSCTMCHTVFPELTPFGRSFKLTGYTMSKSTKPYEFPPPLAGLLQLSFTHLDKDLPRGSIEDNWATHVRSTDNNVLSLPQEASLYYAGRIYEHLGAFVQGTFDGAEKDIMLDMTDIRYAKTTTLFNKQLLFGLTINNSPTLEDVWNSTPAFGFPSATSSVAPTPAAAAIVDGMLDQQVGGIGGYGFWNNTLYAGGALYGTARHGITKILAAGTSVDTVVEGAAPYWRLVLQHQWEKQFVSVGTFGMVADIYPEGEVSGPTDRFTDIAFDAQYQYVGKKHFLSGHALWIHEDQDWDASFSLGNTGKRSGHLDTFRTHGHYYYRTSFGDLGGSIGYFFTTGNKDTVLYAPDPVGGSRRGKPDSNGFIFELEYQKLEITKFLSLKASLQYTLYDKFNGAHSNYDGFGRDASDNNTLYFLLWFMF
ncbi:MAG: hypothetical protein ACE144_10760 [Thermodesulfobacteriota bacterium]